MGQECLALKEVELLKEAESPKEAKDPRASGVAAQQKLQRQATASEQMAVLGKAARHRQGSPALA
ncbi:MAG: hypothetical protein HY360_15050 [Verrucomicrobia bacterium]|nr:hypothetical protein [Verrucomicrobiota bacterium]